MANRGFALYRKEKNLYLIPVAYEYADAKFVGFDNAGDVYKISKLSEKQKEWLKSNDPSKNEKTKGYTFVGDYYTYKVFFKDLPKGRPYTQLPGGGGVYKETRKYNFIPSLFTNQTFLRALENYGTFTEGRSFVRKLIRETIEKLIYTKKMKMPGGIMFGMFEDDVELKQENPAVGFTAVAIEDESERKKINDVYDFLKEQGLIPEGFTRPTFKDGTLDYHMTIKLGELPVGFKKDIDRDVVLNIETVGISNDAVALGVSGDYFSDNEFQHITLAFKYYPKDSKLIQNWEPLEKPFRVKGTIREFTPEKELIKRGVFDEANQIQIGNFQVQAVPAGRGSSFPKEED